MKNFTNITTGISVSNFEKSLEWYKTWLWEPSEIPMKGLAEWAILPNALIWVWQSEDENFQKSDVIIWVKNLYEYTEELKSLWVEVWEIKSHLQKRRNKKSWKRKNKIPRVGDFLEGYNLHFWCGFLISVSIDQNYNRVAFFQNKIF